MHLASQQRPSDKMHQASATPRSSSGSQKPQRVIPKDPGLNEAGGAEERGAEAREGGGTEAVETATAVQAINIS